MRTPSASEDSLDKLSRAGKVTKEAREFAVESVRAGGGALELVQAIEDLIQSNGAECAFPVNIGVNEVAAHYTPSKETDITFRTGDVVKIDIGAHIDGYPGDTAATVEVGTRNHSSLIEAAESALEMSIEMVSPGTTVSAMGETIERAIKASGFKPIQNLTGHSMERFNLHAGLSIPNVRNWDRSVIREGMVLAIEPFSTTGRGKVEGGPKGGIYRLVRDRRAPPEISTLFSRIQSSFGGFPFAGRWCNDLHPQASSLLPKMVRMGMAMSYPILIEAAKGTVAQAEHSIIVTQTGCEVLTR